MNNIRIDFANSIKRVKPMHGVNNGPVFGAGLTVDRRQDYIDMGVPYARLHDTQYPFGQEHFVDIHCIFKNFNADPFNPDSYDFDMTDIYIENI